MSDTNITEKLEYKTSILTAYDGSEQRICTRSNARRYITYNYSSMTSYQAQWLRALLRMRQSTYIYIPMWHSAIMLNSPATAGSKGLYIDSKYMFDLHNCDAILIFSEDSITQGNQVYVVDGYEDGIIGLKTKLTTDLAVDSTYIYPMIQCSVQPASGLNYVFSGGSELVANFEDILYVPTFDVPSKYLFDNDEDYEDKNIDNLPLSLNNREVFLLSPQWVDDDGVSLSITKNTEKLDNDTGVFMYDLKNNYSYDKHTYKFLLINRQEIHNIKRFFNRVKGKFKSFYMPTWVRDITPSSSLIAGNNFIYTELSQLYKFYGSTSRKKYIVIFTNDNITYVYKLLSFSTEVINNVTYGKIYLYSPISKTIPLSDIKMVSFMNHVRLDDDSLQINYETCNVATCTLSMMEVDDI